MNISVLAAGQPRQDLNPCGEGGYLQQLLLPGGSWQVLDAELALLDATAHAEASPRPQRVAVKEVDGIIGDGGRAVFGISEAPVLTAEVHHEPEFPKCPHRAEEGDEQVLVDIPWDLADKDLTARPRWGTVPH